ncbi:hypothetical protein D9613_009895 [Agrocybe pediades]|uniref:Uncharacterized protein n=1 Tax=Agrocybe pediades TaxID=84607 RepID=A0A8H4VSJ1_9AGAR|nr:hypothetical protein D9613_009895 [Agrocybe pediades]
MPSPSHLAFHDDDHTVPDSELDHPSKGNISSRPCESLVSTLFDCPDSVSEERKAFRNALRTKITHAAHVSNVGLRQSTTGPESTLGTLLQANAPNAFLYPILDFKVQHISLEYPPFRLLSSVGASVAGVVGPPVGLATKAAKRTMRNQAHIELALPNICLPLFISTNFATSMATSTAATRESRSLLGRMATCSADGVASAGGETASRRGWEKTVLLASAASSWGRPSAVELAEQ